MLPSRRATVAQALVAQALVAPVLVAPALVALSVSACVGTLGGPPEERTGDGGSVEPADGGPGPDGGLPDGAPGDSGLPPAPSCGRDRANVPAATRTLWVAPTGSDASGDGSAGKPFATIAGARASLRPGDALLLRGGTYRPSSSIVLEGLVGTASAWIRIAAAPGEKVILDGSAAGGTSGGILTLAGSSYVALEGLEVTKGGALVHVEDCDHVVVRDMLLHGGSREGLLLVGSDLVAEDNQIWDVANVNAGGAMAGGGWPGGIDSFHRKSGGLTTGLVVRRNRVRDVWGECIIAAFVDGATIADNAVSDCYSTGIYGDHVRNVRVERNLVWTTSTARDIAGSAMTGVDFMVEEYGSEDPGPFPTEHVVVANNVVARVGTAFGWYSEWDVKGNSYGDLLFANNVVYQGKDAAFRFVKPGAAAGAAGPVRLLGNVVVAPMAFDVRGAPVTAQGNCYEVAELGDLADPKATLGGCGLAAPAVPPTFDAFKLGPGAKAKGAGAPAKEVPLDAFCAPRSPTSPSAGVAE